MIYNITDTDYYDCVRRVRAYTADKDRTAHVMVFGCQQNEADGETIRGMLLDMGYTLCDSYEDADIIIVVTCAIRDHAEKKVLSMLGHFRKLKEKNPNLIIGIVGCMAAEPGVVDKLKKDFHYVTFTIPPNFLHKLPQLILNKIDTGKRSFYFEDDNGDVVEGAPVLRSEKFKAWVPIMYGCNNFCSYCIVPYVRGRERSRSSDAIIKECKELILSGVKEITLLGQNVNSYKSDLSFPELLSAIADIDGEFILRFMTSHPKDASDELIRVMAEKSDKIAPFFHLPLQSGSNSVLKRMNRTYTRERYLSLIEKLRAAIPNIALSTDIIVAFPNETDEDFAQTMDIIKSVGFDMVYSFIYSKRDGTVAARMKNNISDADKRRRMDELLTEQAVISHQKNVPYLNKKVRVLAEDAKETDNGYVYTGRTDTNKTVHFKSDSDVTGRFVNVLINEIGAFDLFGEII
jgi:tRNA-2-methylthio-N6-dimethylallyladenosine synthase